jgi:sterol 3beta-glucosyltransferase
MPATLILCAGSRGDVEPFAALAAALATTSANPSAVVAYTPADYTHLMPPSATTHALPYATPDAFACFADPPPAGTPPHVAAWAGLGRMIDRLVLPAAPAAVAAARDAGVEVVVTSYLTRPLALVVAGALGVKVIVVQLQPQVPTAMYPHHCRPAEAAAAMLAPVAKDDHLESFVALERLLYDIFSGKMNSLREGLSLPALSFVEFIELSVGRSPAVLIANAFPESLVKSAPDAGPSVRYVGPLADAYFRPSASAEEAAIDAAVRDFLAAGEPPVCVGLGSMQASPEVCRMVVAAVRDAGVGRAVLVAGESGLGAALFDNFDGSSGGDFSELRAWIEASTISVDSVSYPWLLPQCSLMVCHGGAGVLSTTLRAGVPAVVVPKMFDQFLWARLVEGRSLGVFVKPSLETTSRDALADGIRRAGTAEVRAASRKVGNAIREGELGTKRLTQLISDLVK